MLVVVTVGAMILTSVSVALHSLFGVDRRMRQEVVQTTMLTRLSIVFRRDAHEAVSASVENEPNKPVRLVLTMADGQTIEYTAEPSRLVRIARDGEERRHREVFALPDRAVVGWETEAVETNTLIIFKVVHQTGAIEAAQDAQRVHRLEAVVGLDQQYSNVGS